MHSSDLGWDDIRLFLALTRGRKLAIAGKMIGVDASTLSRRLVALEERCGMRLFERTRDGLVPTAAAERLVKPAEQTETSVTRFFDEVRPAEHTVEGVVRITAPPGVIELVVIPTVRELLRAHPKLRLELDGSESIASLSRREADIAVRLVRPIGEGLVIRRVGPSPNAIFGSKTLVASLGELHALDDAPWITWDAAHAEFPTARWFASHVKRAPVIRTATMLAQIAAVERSLGIALLPVFIASRRGLAPVRLSNKRQDTPPADEVFLVGQAALRHAPRIKTVWAFLLDALLRAGPGPV